MTKEELEKEAEEFLQKKWGTSKMLILGGDAREVLADFVEPREKQIEIDAKQIRALQKQSGELADKLEMGIALKDEEISCILTDFNTFKSEAKEIIKTFLGFAEAFGYSPSMDKFITEAEQFLNEVEK